MKKYKILDSTSKQFTIKHKTKKSLNIGLPVHVLYDAMQGPQILPSHSSVEVASNILKIFVFMWKIFQIDYDYAKFNFGITNWVKMNFLISWSYLKIPN